MISITNRLVNQTSRTFSKVSLDTKFTDKTSLMQHLRSIAHTSLLSVLCITLLAPTAQAQSHALPESDEPVGFYLDFVDLASVIAIISDASNTFIELEKGLELPNVSIKVRDVSVKVVYTKILDCYGLTSVATDDGLMVKAAGDIPDDAQICLQKNLELFEPKT